jgi:hypothetical protein
MTKFKKDDLVRVHATRFNAPDGKKDKNGRTFAEDWEKKGHGEWCHGRVTFVYKKKSRQPQKYRILYDEGTVMESLEEHMEATAEGDSDDEEDTTEDLEYTQAEVEDQEDGPPGNEEEGEDGVNKGFVKQKQARCKYCRHRIDEAGGTGRAPRTCFQCVCHGVAVCKKFNCWRRHLAGVTQEHESEFAI